MGLQSRTGHPPYFNINEEIGTKFWKKITLFCLQCDDHTLFLEVHNDLVGETVWTFSSLKNRMASSLLFGILVMFITCPSRYFIQFFTKQCMFLKVFVAIISLLSLIFLNGNFFHSFYHYISFTYWIIFHFGS